MAGYIQRQLDLASIIEKKSCFLLGPRQTGKTSLIRYALPEHRRYDLLDSETFLTLSRHPKRLEEEIQPGDRIVIIDEVQKLPHLLDEVHRLIEKTGLRFLLTGSSAQAAAGGSEPAGGAHTPSSSASLHPS